MTRLIDADELLTDNTWTWFDEWGNCTPAGKIIMDAPTIDAEPVLHCKDCKHWHNGVNITYCYKLSLAMIKGNDYCSFGERKEP